VVNATTASIPRQPMFSASVMGSRAFVALAIARFICVEVVELFLSTTRQRPNVSVMRVKAVIYMAEKAVVAMEPWSGSDKHPADIPVGAIVAVGGAVIRSIVEVTVRAHRRHTDADGNLGRTHGRTT